MTSRPRLVTPVAMCCAALLTSCGTAEKRPEASAAARARVDIRIASCADWKQATARERGVLLADLQAFFSTPISDGGDGPEGPGPTLAVKQAKRVFGAYCAQPYARAFKLYKLYGRAAAFDPAG
jgi:hypothetical protein